MSGQARSVYQRFREFPPRLLALAIGMGFLGLTYWANLRALYQVWSDDPTYSHGFLVIPIALVIFWQRLADTRIDWQASRVPWWSGMPLAAIMVARALAYVLHRIEKVAGIEDRKGGRNRMALG